MGYVRKKERIDTFGEPTINEHLWPFEIQEPRRTEMGYIRKKQVDWSDRIVGLAGVVTWFGFFIGAPVLLFEFLHYGRPSSPFEMWGLMILLGTMFLSTFLLGIVVLRVSVRMLLGKD